MCSIRRRDKYGQFSQKSDEPREVRSLRLTDSTWNKMGEIAEAVKITRADVIEEIFERNLVEDKKFSKIELLSLVQKILDDQKITRGGKDKEAVKRALETLLNMLPD